MLLPLIQVHSFVTPTLAATIKASVAVEDGTPAELPVIVTVTSPSTAEGLAVSVSTLLPVVGFGLNDAVTPLGSPDAANVTLPANPPPLVSITVLAPDAPWVRTRPLGESESVNAVIVTISVAVAGAAPAEVPVMVIAAVPSAAVALAVTVSTLPPAVGFLPNDAVTPLGKPDAARVTPPVNPATSKISIMPAPDEP